MFTGRPPLLSHRYASTPLPLDIEDEVLTADEETIERAVARLDKKGWNTSNELYPATVLRARFMFALIRDELLEIALGSVRNSPIERLLYVMPTFGVSDN